MPRHSTTYACREKLAPTQMCMHTLSILQDFARVLPIMHPDACEAFMNEMLKDTAAFLRAAPRSSLNAVTIMHAVLGRPNVDVGGPDYITDLPPMMDRDTNNYVDMVYIMRAALDFYGFVPLVLRAIGDGQSVLMLSYLKRAARTMPT